MSRFMMRRNHLRFGRWNTAHTTCMGSMTYGNGHACGEIGLVIWCRWRVYPGNVSFLRRKITDGVQNRRFRVIVIFTRSKYTLS